MNDIKLDKNSIYQRFMGLKNAIKQKQPLIHAITNYVALYPNAQIIQGFGARPTMSEHESDMPAISKKANAHCINLGMMTPDKEKAFYKIIEYHKAPILLDCVMVHLYPQRLEIARKLSQYATIIKGNDDEIAALNINNDDKIMISTGKYDIIQYHGKCYIISNGDEMMANIVTLGCCIGSFLSMVLAVTEKQSLLKHIITSMIAMGIAGQITAKNTATAFDFLNQWQQQLYLLNESDFSEYYQEVRIET